jgi:SAM-dependent methyltransferase
MTLQNNPDDPALERLLEILLRCACEGTPVNVALSQLLMAASSAEEASRALGAAARHLLSDPDRQEGARRLRQMRVLWDETPGALAHIKAVMGSLQHPGARNPQPTAETWGAIFDRAVGLSPEASVALYSLGRTDLLHAATREIMDWICARHLTSADACLLDVGCGSGRIVEMAARHVKIAIGADVSAGMLQAARERCADCRNASFVRTSGTDLAVFRDASIDLVCAVDVFPYFVMSGLAERHVGEMARVLRRGGHLLILNYAYDRCPTAGEDELRRFAQDAGLSLRYSAKRMFSLWDGTCYLLRKSGRQERSL